MPTFAHNRSKSPIVPPSSYVRLNSFYMGFDKDRGIITFGAPCVRCNVCSTFPVDLATLMRTQGFTAEQQRGFVHTSGFNETPDVPFEQLQTDVLPLNLAGKTVLDIGGYDGFVAKECKDRGAASCHVVDNGEWKHYNWKKPRILAGISYHHQDVMEWNNPADIVICYNVIYHSPDPFGFARKLRELTKETLFICSSVVWSDDPIFRFYDGSEENEAIYDDTYTVYFRPSEYGLLKLLKRVGFSHIEKRGRHTNHLIFQAS